MITMVGSDDFGRQAHDAFIASHAPIEDRLLVRRMEPPDETPGGLTIPAAAKKSLMLDEGVVLRAGKGRWTVTGERIPMDCREGDHVFFQSNAGYEVPLHGEKLLVLREQEVLLRTQGES